MGRDEIIRFQLSAYGQFQSTRPIWGATTARRGLGQIRAYFNPRAPYGARLYGINGGLVEDPISIHAPHMGRDENLSAVVLVFC